MVAVADVQDPAFDVVGGPAGGADGATRPVDQRRGGDGAAAAAEGVEDVEPLVGGLAADAELAGDGGDGPVQRADGVTQRETDLGHGGHLPGHLRASSFRVRPDPEGACPKPR